MNRKLNILLIGLGAVGKDLVKPLMDKGVNIIGAVDMNPDLIGKDLGDVVGIGAKLGVTVTNDAQAILSSKAVDVSILCVSTDPTVMLPLFEQCLRAKSNVITATDGVGFPWRIAPDLGPHLDKLASENGVSILSSGFQDPYTFQIISLLAGTCFSIDEIHMSLTSNLNHVGAHEMQIAGIGLDKDTFEMAMSEAQNSPLLEGKTAYMECITAHMGLTTKSIENWVDPIITQNAIHTPVLDQTIDPGKVIGSHLNTRINTEEGIVYHSVMSFVIYPDGKPDLSPFEVRISGNPDVNFVGKNIDIHAHVCQALINRIPDVLNAKPGLVSLDQLPRPRFYARDYSEYVS